MIGDTRMASYYYLVQFAPTVDERITFGAIAIDDEGCHVRFLSDWSRVRAVARGAVDWLKSTAVDFTKTVPNMPLPELPGAELLTKERLDAMASGWTHSVQITPARASILPAPQLLEQVCARALVQRTRKTRTYRDRSQAARLLARRVRHAFSEIIGEDRTKDLVFQNGDVDGKCRPHKFDVVIRNGHLISALHALSYEPNEEQDVHANLTAFAIQDSQIAFPDAQYGVLCLPPARSTRRYQDDIEMFRTLGAEVVTEAQFEPWIGTRAFDICTALPAV